MTQDPSDHRLKKLQLKLSALYGRLQTVYDSMSQIDNDPIKIDNFLADSFTIDGLKQEFTDTIDERNQYQMTIPDGPAPNYSSLISFEQLYSRIKYKVHKLSQMTKNISRNDKESAQKSLKLPPIELCQFDGSFESWPNFYETFKVLIHENGDLTDGQRIHYLMGKLKGKALNACQGISPIAENYASIWNALVNKYNDKRVMAASYLDKLFSLPNIKDNSPASLEEFIDKFSSIHSALKQLKLNLEDYLFIYIACKKVGLEVVKEFELKHHKDNDYPTCTEFINFVRNHSHIMQRANSFAYTNTKVGSTQARKNTTSSAGSSVSRHINNNNNVKTFVNVSEQIKCVSCGRGEHSQLSQCNKFLSMPPQERYKLVKSNKLCVNCLSNEHALVKCTNRIRCSECGKSHHTLLHFPTNSTSAVATERVAGAAASLSPESGPVSLCALSAVNLQATGGPRNRPKTSILLGTALCRVVNAEGTLFTVRALIDSASQRDLITTECCNRLNLKLHKPQSKYVTGVGDISNPIEGVTCLTICSHFDDTCRFDIQPVVVNRITSELPTAIIDNARLEYLNNINLADKKYYYPASIDLILGSDVFCRILGKNKIARAADEPVAIETLLGYVIVGQAPVLEPAPSAIRTHCTLDEPLEMGMHRFFELEEVPNAPNILTSDEQRCENYYTDTTGRDCHGRYVVSLPFRENPSVLGESMKSAERRYLSLENKLSSAPIVKREYDNVFVEYLQKNYITPVGTVSEFNSNNDQYVIPHHGVVRTDKSTTKLRVVLNASNPTSSGKSLNDILYTGPNLQRNLFKILLNFRLHSIALSADIRQMYLRIIVASEDRRFQRLLYRFNLQEPITVFEMTRVPFGLCCSPYLAIRTVRKLAEDERERFPVAAAVAETDIYTDDLATSCSSVSEGVALSNQLIDLFAAGGFDLVKFSSNSPEVLESIPASHRVSEAVEFSPGNQLKILGLHWVQAEDAFTFSVNTESRECTKRTILSTIARLWDLMGFVAPVTLLAKLLLKAVWKEKIEWDEPPSPNLVTLWKKFEVELPLLKLIKLPRHVGVSEGGIVSVLGFADASESGYGGVVYLHVYFPATEYTVVNLVCAKSKVAPSKTVITLARMELCATVILAKLMRVVINTYSSRCKIDHIFAFTDSTVTLAWIHSSPTRWQTFVANRVAQIHENINPEHFHHIPGKDNPADCLSRGLTPAELLENSLWYNGPRFCYLPFAEWPVRHFDPSLVDEVPEIKIKTLVTTLPEPPSSATVFGETASRVSSWPKLLRIAIYVLRFCKRLPKTFEVAHLDQVELTIIRDLQNTHFSNEILSARTGKKLTPALLKLNAFLKDGILRVGGRLTNADVDYNSRHPMLLPRKDNVVNLIIDYYHRKYLHAGPQLLMSLLRQRFWILSARNIVRKRIQLCTTCFRANPRNEFPLMASLPACRVQEAKAFCHTGVDYAGPLQVLPFRRRGVRSQKAYICLFICLVTKAVHIELASDLSTECFIYALKRFISRRGPVSVMYSDCGTNFIGAKTYLDSVYQLLESEEYKDKFSNELRDNRIQWKYNPASAPHFGGVWESNIKCIKTHLSRVVGNHLLTMEEMSTTLIQIEAILNSRPLSVLSSDPAEPLALTPAHFLVMTPLKSLPAEDLTASTAPLTHRKRMVDQLVQSFWRRWQVEYLNTLQVRKKWLTASQPVQTGSVVLLKSDNSAPLDWPMGIIERTYPGKDGVIRVVDVRTKSGVYRRPVVKVFPLPHQH